MAKKKFRGSPSPRCPHARPSLSVPIPTSPSSSSSASPPSPTTPPSFPSTPLLPAAQQVCSVPAAVQQGLSAAAQQACPAAQQHEPAAQQVFPVAWQQDGPVVTGQQGAIPTPHPSPSSPVPIPTTCPITDPHTPSLSTMDYSSTKAFETFLAGELKIR
ncbi:hypothetical protein O6H91_03G014000 [Diphasiastrum complanatum]|uniref:Uncharacterized protein n=1 Tax=Diphasiastrum complanatum TaxID=34168 RepID=A0ACC2E3P4_DIPCM|nr:hypothetical protein O6H91_03G014000 [Diphasiastrum complanatum]